MNNFSEMKLGEVLYTTSGLRARLEEHVYVTGEELLGVFSLYDNDGDYVSTMAYESSGFPMGTVDHNLKLVK